MAKVGRTDDTTVKSAYGQDVNIPVTFTYDEYDGKEADFDTATEAVGKAEVVDLINARNKSNARSAAIAKATLPYKPDPNSATETRKRMIADAMRGNKKLTEEQATALVDSILSA